MCRLNGLDNNINLFADEQGPYFDNVTKLIEETYEKNGGQVILHKTSNNAR